MNDKFVKVRRAASVSNRLNSTYQANMSHEIRTPLNGNHGVAQVMLQTKVLASDTHNDVEIFDERGNSLVSIIDDIMDLSKVETYQHNLRKKQLDLNDLMDQLYAIFQSSPLYWMKNEEQQNLRLICDKPDESVVIMSDPVRLKQIMTYLIENALRYTESGFVRFGYTVTINSVSKNHFILFYVKDSGVGIPQDKTKMIFDKFEPVDDSSKRKKGWFGLRLAISKGLANMLYGKLWCKSDPGKGTNFFFAIPYHPVVMPENTDAQMRNGGVFYDWSDYTVMIVEDDIISYKVINAMLSHTKINVIHANSGQKAVELARLNPHIDLALMNIHLPEMDGLEATSKIHDFYPSLPVIAHTADIMSDDREKFLNKGCADYISTPINMNELIYKMSRFLPKKTQSLTSPYLSDL